MKSFVLALLCAFASLALAQHSATLTWQPSTAAQVGYNVYRCTGTAATCGNPFTGVISNYQQTLSPGWTRIIGSLNASMLTYIDANLPASTTYSYVVTAYDTQGKNWESVASNVWTGTTPADTPQPPSGGGTSGQTPPPGTLSGSVQ